MNCQKRRNMFEESISIWGEKPKKKGVINMEKQEEFEFAKDDPDKCMEEISKDAKKELCSILDRIIKNGVYTEGDIKDISNAACWIEKI